MRATLDESSFDLTRESDRDREMKLPQSETYLRLLGVMKAAGHWVSN